MQGAKKAASRIGLKGSNYWTSGDPHALRDNCSVCGVWTEDLDPNTKRCYRSECTSLLIERALTIGCATRINTGSGYVIIGNLNAAIPYTLPEGGKKISLPRQEKTHMCGCGKDMKRPNDNYCVRCRLDKNAKKYKKGMK